MTLLPLAFRTAGRHRLVEMIDPARIDWRAGFFTQGLPQQHPFDAILPFCEWRESERARTGFSGMGGIFHVSRCGSTLLSQNLKATGKALVLSEPHFMRILRTRFDGSLDMGEAVGAVAQVIGQWRDWAQRSERVLVVKFNSQTHQWREALQAAMPGARFAFLHRPPAPVFESIHRHPPGYLQRDAQRFAANPNDAFAGLDEDPVLLAAARRYCAALGAFEHRGGDAVLPLAFGDLAPRFAEICAHFGIGDIAPDAWDGAIDAKATDPGSARPYRPVSDERVAAFAARHPELLAVAEAAYRNFLEAGGTAGGTRGGAAA